MPAACELLRTYSSTFWLQGTRGGKFVRIQHLFPIWSGLALRAPPRTWWSWGWRTTIGTPTKTAPSFGTLKMENWLRFRRRLTIRRQVIVAQVGKIVRCTCGGYLRRDLDWPPPKIHVRREQKKTLTRPKIQPKNTACPLLEERESRREKQVLTRIKISESSAIPNSSDNFLLCSPQLRFQEGPWRLIFRKYCKRRWSERH